MCNPKGEACSLCYSIVLFVIGGVFSPINDAIGRGSGSGVGLSPLTYSGYPLSEQNRNSPGILDYNRMNNQVSLYV